MSNHQSSGFSASSSSSFSYSSSSCSANGVSTGTRSSQQTYTDAHGNTTVRTTSQNLGEPMQQETRHYDSRGQERLGGFTACTDRRIEDVGDRGEQQARNDRLYEERMEDEYAKREGGA